MILDQNGDVITTSTKAIFNEIASLAQADVIAFMTRLPHPSRLLKRRTEIWELYDKVAEQIDVDAAISDYKNGIASMEEDVVCASNPNSKLAQFFTRYLKFVNTKQFRRLACGARDYGCAFIEVKEWAEFEGVIVPKVLVSRPRKFFGFDTDGVARFYPLGKLASPKFGSEGIPLKETYPNNFITLRFEDDDLNPYGRGKLDKAYYFALGLNGVAEFMMTFLEEDGRDKWIFRHPEGASREQIYAGLENARKLRNSGIGAVSENSAFEQKDVKGRQSTSDAYRIADEILSAKILKAWYGVDLLMQKSGKGGYAQTQSGIEIRAEALMAGVELSQTLMHGVFDIIKNINTLPDQEDAVEYRLFHARSTSKEEAEMYKLYFEMGGAKPTDEFYTNRGIAREEYERIETSSKPAALSTSTTPATETAEFSADDLNQLSSAFDTYWNGVKKKS